MNSNYLKRDNQKRFPRPRPSQTNLLNLYSKAKDYVGNGLPIKELIMISRCSTEGLQIRPELEKALETTK